MTSETIKLQIDYCDFYGRFSNVLNDDSIYSSAAGREYVTNYRNHTSKRGNNDPLDIIPNAFGRAAHDAVLYALLSKSVDKAVKDAVIKSGGTVTD